MLDDFREWLSDNLRYILLGLAVILIVVIGFCVVKLVTGSSDSSSKKKDQVVTESEIATEAPIAATEAQAQSGATAAVGTSDLVKDDTAILTLVKKYYTAVAGKDVTTLETIVSPWNDDVKAEVLRNDGVIESYNNISTYSKKGFSDNSYVVYVYFEGKVVNIDTQVPSLSMLYLTANAGGDLIVTDWETSQEIADYVETVKTDTDVQALIADVESQCEVAKAADPALKEFMETPDASTSEEGGSTVATEISGEMVVTADAINNRQEPNTSSAIMGMLVSSTTITVIETAEDGWVKISYNSSAGVIEGYVKQEYLAAPGTTTTADDGTV